MPVGNSVIAHLSIFLLTVILAMEYLNSLLLLLSVRYLNMDQGLIQPLPPFETWTKCGPKLGVTVTV